MEKGLERLRTAYSQQRRYFSARGLNRDVRQLLKDHLIKQLTVWRKNGKEIILFVDANEHIYKGSLSRRLGGPELGLKEQFKEQMGFQFLGSLHRKV